MKAIFALATLAFASCVSTTTTYPDGRVVTVKAPAPGTVEIVVPVAEIISNK